jgi:hypothetical protein
MALNVGVIPILDAKIHDFFLFYLHVQKLFAFYRRITQKHNRLTLQCLKS